MSKRAERFATENILCWEIKPYWENIEIYFQKHCIPARKVDETRIQGHILSHLQIQTYPNYWTVAPHCQVCSRCRCLHTWYQLKPRFRRCTSAEQNRLQQITCNFMRSTASKSIRNGWFNLDGLGQSIPPDSERTALDRLWFRRHTSHESNKMHKLF